MFLTIPLKLVRIWFFKEPNLRSNGCGIYSFWATNYSSERIDLVKSTWQLRGNVAIVPLDLALHREGPIDSNLVIGGLPIADSAQCPDMLRNGC